MTRRVLFVLAIIGIVLVLSSLPVLQAPVSSAAPPPTSLPVATAAPTTPIATSQPARAVPVPGDLLPALDRARARQAIEAALGKYLAYWGARYRVEALDVAVQGEWAHGAAQWAGEARTLQGPLHILARRLPDRSWQALLPGSDGAYGQWLDAAPAALLTAGEKSTIRAQVAEAAARQRQQATPQVPPAATSTPIATQQPYQQPTPISRMMYASATPTTQSVPATGQAISVTWAVEGDISVVYAVDVTGRQTKVAEAPFTRMLFPQFSAFVTLSNDGRVISYLTADNEMLSNAELWLVDADGTDRRLLATFVDDLWIAPPVWSPDAQRLAFTRPVRAPNEPGIELWVIDTSSGKQERVSNTTGLTPDLFYGAHPPVMRWTQLGIEYTDYVSQPGVKIIRTIDPPSGTLEEKTIPLTTTAAQSIQATLPCGVSQFSQNDPQWSSTVMQTCGLSIGAAGCAVTGVSMNFRYFGVETSPATLNSCLGTKACPIYWGDAASQCSSGKASFTCSGCGWLGFSWGTVESNLNSGRPVLVELDKGSNTHFVVVIAGSGSSASGYTINDPWDGQQKSLSSYTNSSWTTGSLRVYGGTPWCQGGGSACAAPTLTEPGDGAVSSNRTITFRWNALSGCTFNGYTFRLCTSSDVNNLSNCFLDTGVGETYRTETINGRDNQDLWWGVKAANAPNGASWSVRRFRIEPYVPPSCSYNADQIVLYADTGYGGNCVTLGVGDYPNPGNLGNVGNDNTESIRLGSNVQAILYENDNYGGRADTHSSDDSNLSDNTIGNNQVSSVKVQWKTTTPSAPTLSMPGNGNVYDEGATFTLFWNSSAGATEYQAQYWGGPAGTLTSNWQSPTSWYIGQQWAGYTYSWHARAHNSAGDSAWSSTWTFTVRPAAPSNLAAQAASCTQINLTWSDNSGNEEGYRIYRNGSPVGTVNGTSYSDGGRSGNTGYSYYVKAYRGSIESTASNTVNISTPPCLIGPDLVPAQWGGWQYPIVPSSVRETSVVNMLYAGAPTYIDWGLTNNGDTATGGNTFGDLYIDGTRYGHYDFGDVTPGLSWAFFDWMETIATPGWHTLRVVVDPDNLIAESNENNNTWQGQFYWVASAPFADDLESGATGWSVSGLWHLVDSGSPYPASWSWPHSFWYGQDSSGTYDTGDATSGDLTAPAIYIPASGYYLRYWYRYETEMMGDTWDKRWLQISVDGGAFNNVLQMSDDPMNTWLQSRVVDLSGYAGHAVQIRFRFDSLDATMNAYRGWYIDDLSISTAPPPSCADGYEPNDTPGTATYISYGQYLGGDICPGGDFDFYRFDGTAGDKVVVDMNAMIYGSSLDTYIYLLDSDGSTVLAEHDDEITAQIRDAHLGYQLGHDGVYYIKVKAWNHPSVGGTNYYYDIHLLADSTNPSSAAITSPSNDAWINPYAQSVWVSAEDGESGVRNATFLWHSSDWETSDWQWLGDDFDPRDGWSWNFDTSVLTEQRGGAFYIWAFDWAGNWTGAAVWNLGIDRSAPVASAVVSQMYGDAQFIDFHVWCSGWDNVAGIASYDVQYRDGAGGSWTDLLVDVSDPYYHFAGQDDHTYYFRARAIDNAGNESGFAGGDGDDMYSVNVCDVAPDAYEADNSAGSARLVNSNGSVKSHNFHGQGDQDWVKFNATAGYTYTLATSNNGGYADTVLYLYGPDGATLIIANDDYPGSGLASRIEWRATGSGRYYARVAHWDQYAYGCSTAYGLSITEIIPPYEQRVRVGGPAVTDLAGALWSTDTAWTSGLWGFVGGTTGSAACAIAGTDDDALYQGQRQWSASAIPGYRFTVPNGEYEVVLKFSENTNTPVGGRVFSVRAEGLRLIANLDIRAHAGAKCTAHDETFRVPVVDGQLTLDFLRGVGSPKVDAISVRLVGPYVNRINAGSRKYTDGGGQVWAADKPLSSGGWGYSDPVTKSTVLTTTQQINGTDDDFLFQSARSGMSGYTLAVPNGAYAVTLRFAEPQYNRAGKRVFDVNIEGSTVLSYLDIWQSAGRYAALDYTFVVTVKDKALNISFVPRIGLPVVSAIEVRQQ